MRRNATKSWKLVAILDFGFHFDFVYMTDTRIQNWYIDLYPQIGNENKTFPSS